VWVDGRESGTWMELEGRELALSQEIPAKY
jgi:hypothetical protein